MNRFSRVHLTLCIIRKSSSSNFQQEQAFFSIFNILVQARNQTTCHNRSVQNIFLSECGRDEINKPLAIWRYCKTASLWHRCQRTRCRRILIRTCTYIYVHVVAFISPHYWKYGTVTQLPHLQRVNGQPVCQDDSNCCDYFFPPSHGTKYLTPYLDGVFLRSYSEYVRAQKLLWAAIASYYNLLTFSSHTSNNSFLIAFAEEKKKTYYRLFIYLTNSTANAWHGMVCCE